MWCAVERLEALSLASGGRDDDDDDGGGGPASQETGLEHGTGYEKCDGDSEVPVGEGERVEVIGSHRKVCGYPRQFGMSEWVSRRSVGMRLDRSMFVSWGDVRVR